MVVHNTFADSPCVVFLVRGRTDYYIEHLCNVRDPSLAELNFVFRGHRKVTWLIPEDHAPETIIQWMRLYRRGQVPGEQPQQPPRPLSEIILTSRKTVI